MNKSAYDTFKRFLDLFSPLDYAIDNFLFQLPPSFSIQSRDKILEFLKAFKLFDKAVIEPRNISWFDEENIEFFEKNNISIVSVDAPIGTFIVKTTDKLYLRMHGRSNWYQYNYSKKELVDDINKIRSLRPKQVYVFFNNDHDMLRNAQLFNEIIRR